MLERHIGATVETSVADSGAAAVRQRETSPGASLAHFWELRGRRIFEEGGVRWVRDKGPFFTSLPFQLKLDLTPAELSVLLRRHKVAGLRFPSRSMPGIAHGMYIARPAGYDLKAVSRKQRGHVMRGLELCDIRDVDPDELLALGLDLNRDTLARQGRRDPEFLDPVQWKRFVRAVRQSPGVSVRGAYVKGRLATYIVSCRDGHCLHLMYKMSRTADLEHYPNHALDYSVIRDAATDTSIECVANGSVPLVADEGLDRYKRQLGYQIEPHNLCIHLHPLLAPLLASRVSLSLARAACSLCRGRHSVAYCSKVVEGAYLTLQSAM